MRSSAEGVRIDCARWLLSPGAAPVEDGALATEAGRVLAAGKRRAILKDLAGRVLDHGEAAILPGLVNCHAHLELTGLAGRVSGEGFCGWLLALIDLKAGLSLAQLRGGVRQGLAQARGCGTALVADVVSPLTVAAGLYPPGQALALIETLGFSSQQAENRWALARAALAELEADGVAAGLAPHSPYTVSRPLLRGCANWDGLISIHVAESAEEVEFLRTGGSPIRELLVARRAWDQGFQPPRLSPVRYLDRLGLLGPRTLAVHLVQAGRGDIDLLARRKVSAVLCPRSNQALGVGAPPLAAMLAAGLRVCLGTDSLASNSDLNLFREAQAAVSLGATPEEALRMATLSGAAALGQPQLGSLERGRRPQPLVVPVEGSEPVASALEAGARGEARFLFEERGVCPAGAEAVAARSG